MSEVQQQEIELDTDGIEEESVEVQPVEQEVESVSDAVGEVDLGYKDHV